MYLVVKILRFGYCKADMIRVMVFVTQVNDVDLGVLVVLSAV